MTAAADQIAFDDDGVLNLPLSTFDNTGKGRHREDLPEENLGPPIEPEAIRIRLHQLMDAWDEAEDDPTFRAQIESEIHQLQAAAEEIVVQQAREDFDCFMEYCFKTKDGTQIEQGQIHLEWTAACDTYQRVAILAPRDHGKTEQVAVGRVIWELGREQNLRIKIVCQNDQKARERLFQITEHLERNPAIRAVFPELKPAKKGDWTKHRIVVQRETILRDASVEAIGVLSSASGGRADLIIGDDVCDRRNSLNFPKLRESVKEAWWSDWTNLLEPDGRVIYIATLWHEDDLSHDIMLNPAYYVVFHAVDDDLEPIWPEVWTEKALRERLEEIGSSEFARGYQNRPLSGDVACVDESWIRYGKAPDPRRLLIVHAYDLAISKKTRADYFAHVSIGVDKEVQKIYVLRARQYRLSFKQQAEQIIAFAQADNPFRVIIEGTGYQQVLAQYLDEQVPLPTMLVNPVQDKTTRLMGITPLLEGEAERFIFDPSLRPATIRDRTHGDLVTQLLKFPLSKHDDMVDAMVHATQFAYDYFLRKIDRVPRIELRIRALG